MSDFNYNVYIKTNAEQAIKEVTAYDKALQKMQETMEKTGVTTRSVNKWLKQLAQVPNPVEFTNKQMKRLDLKLAKAKTGAEVKRIIKDQTALITATQQSPEFKKAYEPAQKMKQRQDSLKKMSGFFDKIAKATQKSSTWVDRLWGRIRNISIYRMIRTGIKWVTSGFREGLQNFAQYNGEVNKTVSELNGNLKQIRNTMGVSLAYTLQSLQPIIEKVLNGITEGLNAFNLALAKMQGKDQFTKAKKNVEDYSKSLEKAKKLSFDTFEVLNSGDSATSPQNMFEQANIDENESKLSMFFEKIFGFVKSISSAIGRIIDRISATNIFDKLLDIGERIAESVTNVIITLLDSGAFDTIIEAFTDIWKIFSKIISACAVFIGFLNKIGLLKPILFGIAAAWLAIKVAAMGAAVASAIAWVAQHPITGSIFLATAVSSAIVLTTNAIKKASGYANGGIPEKSELFYMNENGVPEALVNTGGSQTNVINIDQLSEGMRRGFTQAIYETGLIDAMQTRLVVDGNSVNDNAFARAIFPALKTESRRRGGNQL